MVGDNKLEQLYGDALEQDTLFQNVLTDCYEACGKDTDKITAFLNDALIHSGLSVTSVSMKETYPYPNFN